MNNLTEKEKKAIDELLEGLKKLYGDNLCRVILYGSKARGEGTDDSDIDIMVVLKNLGSRAVERKRISEIVWKVCYKYDVLIGETIKSESEFLNRVTPLMLNVRRDGLVL